jgi:uncharacterized protein YejL (UPF0352 family)
MAMKKKITKAEFDKLADHFKSEYNEIDGNYILDVTGEEDTGALKRAKDREKAARIAAENKLSEIEGELDTLKNDPKARDVKSLEASWLEKHKKEIDLKDASIAKLSDFAKATLADSVALSLAKEISTSPELLLPHIKARIVADLNGDKPVTKILDKEGKVSAFSLEDFKKEVLETPAYSAILIGSKAKGGSATTPAMTPASSASDKHQNTSVDLRTMPVGDMVSRIEARIAAKAQKG